MSNKELYRQKKQAELDEWQAGVDKLKAKASGASADAQLEMNKQIEALEGKIEAGKAKLTELAKASEDAGENLKDEIESVLNYVKSTALEVALKFSG